VTPSRLCVGSSVGAPRGLQPTQKKKWENPFKGGSSRLKKKNGRTPSRVKQWEGEKGEEREEGLSRMSFEKQNLRTPSGSDTVTDTEVVDLYDKLMKMTGWTVTDNALT
jgi:hypothetical protein